MLEAQLQLESTDLAYSLTAVFIAGVVRGFSGFALSALVMASLVIVIPTVDLIPVCFLLELAAGLSMLRGSLGQADMKMVLALVVTSAVGLPIGLYATNVLSVDITRLVALSVILVLALAQLARLSTAVLETRTALYTTGVLSGLAGGLASVGGMVVALYVLGRRMPVAQVRASLVMFLLVSLSITAVNLVGFGMIDSLALTRSAWMMPLVLLGVACGSALFRPGRELVYRRFCLGLLMALALSGLLRELLRVT